LVSTAPTAKTAPRSKKKKTSADRDEFIDQETRAAAFSAKKSARNGVHRQMRAQRHILRNLATTLAILDE
jgi:hypothetical protein